MRKLAFGEAQNTTPAATSSARPRRSKGVVCTTDAMHPSPAALVISVSIVPGATALTLMYGARSFANERVRCIRPAFAVVEAITGPAPSIPYTEGLFTIAPRALSHARSNGFAQMIDRLHVDMQRLVPCCITHVLPVRWLHDGTGVVDQYVNTPSLCNAVLNEASSLPTTGESHLNRHCLDSLVKNRINRRQCSGCGVEGVHREVRTLFARTLAIALPML